MSCKSVGLLFLLKSFATRRAQINLQIGIIYNKTENCNECNYTAVACGIVYINIVVSWKYGCIIGTTFSDYNIRYFILKHYKIS